MARTRLGLCGTPRMPYGSFSGKVAEAPFEPVTSAAGSPYNYGGLTPGSEWSRINRRREAKKVIEPAPQHSIAQDDQDVAAILRIIIPQLLGKE